MLARIAAGEKVISVPDPAPGERLVDAVAMMDKLRTSGPWEQEQTHDSLRRYLLEETYELFDAVRGGDAESLRDELGDVLLQVLFHARIAEDSPAGAFSIDDVAESLVRKLVNRVPAVLAGEPISLDDQLAQWEERKAQENAVKNRTSSMDDVPTGQPALALAQKVIERVTAAGLPSDLIPADILTVTLTPGVDVENTMRSSVLEFMDTVRKVESAVAAGRRTDDVPEELDVAQLGAVSEEEWREHWPGLQPLAEEAGEVVEVVEAVEPDEARESDEPGEEFEVFEAESPEALEDRTRPRTSPKPSPNRGVRAD